MNIPIQNMNPAHTAYYPRLETDKLFMMGEGSFFYEGYIDRAVRYIERVQLLDIKLWKQFANQFRFPADDADLGWRCEYWGKMMRGAGFTYAYTQDKELYRVMEETVRDLLATQDKLGRFSTYSVENEFQGWDLWGRKYVLLGLQYFCDICKDDSLKREIVSAMSRHADYILSQIGPEREGKRPITQTSSFWQGMNSSSILEPVVRLYNITGEQKYLDFASYIVETGAIADGNLFELAYEGRLYPYQYPVTKAYEMMSCFEGLLEYYRATKIEKWRIAAENFVRLVMESDVTVIGCAGCTHELFDHSAKGQTDEERNRTIHMQETCVTVTWMKLCFQLLCLKGDAQYAGAMERSIYNALLGTLNTGKETISVSRSLKGYHLESGLQVDSVILPFDSYSPLLPNIRGKYVGGLKVMENGMFYGCCAAIGAAGTGMIPLASAMLRQDGVSVNLYLPGEIQTFTPDNTPLRLTVKTGYPVSGEITVTAEPETERRFVLALRIPDWSKKTTAEINGKAVTARAGTYLELDREWKPGDKVTLRLDMRTRAVFQDGYVSLSRGPLVLARDARLGRVDEEVAIEADREGYVAAKLTGAVPFEHVLGVEIPVTKGSSFVMIDYSSSGRTWEEDSRTAAWLSCR